MENVELYLTYTCWSFFEYWIDRGPRMIMCECRLIPTAYSFGEFFLVQIHGVISELRTMWHYTCTAYL